MPRQPNENARLAEAFYTLAAYKAGTRVLLTGVRDEMGRWQLVAAGDAQHIGTLLQDSLGPDLSCSVYHANGSGTFAYIANGAIAAGDDVSTAADGKVQTGLTGAVNLGKALNDAAADGDTVEVLPAS